jgi:sugar phosphate permease
MTASLADSRPSNVRFTMIGITTLVAIMLYLDRVCLSILSEQIKPLLHPDPARQTLLFADLTSAFFWMYALFQLPAGWLGDRYGPRYVLALYLFFWSLCTALMGFANGFAALFMLRLGCGLFEAGAYPLAAGIVKTWMPASVRGLASGCVAVGGRLGGAVAPPLTIALASGSDGWRTSFFVYGLIGMLGAIPFAVWYRNRPSEHPAVNDAEARLIGEPTTHSRPLAPPITTFLKSRALWLNSLLQFLSNFAWVFIITLFPAYLKDVFETQESTRARYQSYPLYAGIVGMLLGGWLSDVCVRRFGLRWGRGMPIVLARALVAAAYVGCLFLRDPFHITLMMCLVAFATDMGTAPVWAWAQDVGGRHVGSVVGWANMWGNFGAAIAPMVLGRVQAWWSWDTAFLLCAVVQLFAIAAALGLDARRSLDDEAKN